MRLDLALLVVALVCSFCTSFPSSRNSYGSDLNMALFGGLTVAIVWRLS
jgi:hypothetical protein